MFRSHAFLVSSNVLQEQALHGAGVTGEGVTGVIGTGFTGAGVTGVTGVCVTGAGFAGVTGAGVTGRTLQVL